jgi:hypothetical protein
MHRPEDVALRAANPRNHVHLLAQIFLYQKFAALGRITSVPVDHQNQIGVAGSQRSGDSSRFPAAFFG